MSVISHFISLRLHPKVINHRLHIFLLYKQSNRHYRYDYPRTHKSNQQPRRTRTSRRTLRLLGLCLSRTLRRLGLCLQPGDSSKHMLFDTALVHPSSDFKKSFKFPPHATPTVDREPIRISVFHSPTYNFNRV
jgi:hypothetical protein